jgi:beta-glucosidase
LYLDASGGDGLPPPYLFTIFQGIAPTAWRSGKQFCAYVERFKAMTIGFGSMHFPKNPRGSFRAAVFGSAALVAALMPSGALGTEGITAVPPPAPWMNMRLSPDQRADRLAQAMTREEKFRLVIGELGRAFNGTPKPKDAIGSAGYVPGVPRLGIPALQETDAGLGVTNPMDVRPGDHATALPSGLAMAASFDPEAAYGASAMIADEARSKGFNVLLGGAVNLVRDPAGGRNFEYLGEDPLLAGVMGGAMVRGVEDRNVLATVKHYAVNNQETARFWANSVIDEAAMRESDLLAFEIAVERGRPGAVICSYNLINGTAACDNDHLLNGILKGDWKWPGFVMSDWGAVYGPGFARHGLDQESGAIYDKKPFFGPILKDEIANGSVSEARFSDMVHRILRSMFAAGLFDHPPGPGAVDYAAHGEVTQRMAEKSIVLLKNDAALLPLRNAKRIAIIGCHAAEGVLSGGGSSQVTAAGPLLTIPNGGSGYPPLSTMVFHSSSPLKAIASAVPGAEVRFDDGRYQSSAAKLARWADVAIVFACQWTAEGGDVPDLSLPDRQDQLIEAVAAANGKTVVVLETGGPVTMPWLDKVPAVLEAWYPGSRGAEAIASVLIGKVNPSGRLPVSFPRDLGQMPRPQIVGSDLVVPHFTPGKPPPLIAPFDVPLSEGADVGYRWFAKKNLKPLFPFGYGLSYSRFEYRNVTITAGSALTVGFDVVNAGGVAGSDVPQVYMTSGPNGSSLRLIGFSRVTLDPGETKHVTITADPRLLAKFDTVHHGWQVAAGTYTVRVGPNAESGTLTGSAHLAAATLAP